MTELVLWDNDIAFKMACYQLVETAVALGTREDSPPAMLTVGQYVIRKKLDGHARVRDSSASQAAFGWLLQAIGFVEPIEDELALASEIESEATRAGLDLDSGESQLLAILHSRGCTSLVTGDKRAVIAMAVVAQEMAERRVQCLEQLIAQIVVVTGVADTRAKVCKEPLVDRAISACFGCASVEPPHDNDVYDGLRSYIDHLRDKAPGILVDGLG